jgi:hypothetical protein
MRNMRWLSWVSVVAVTAVMLGAGPVAAVSSDRAAAIVDFPLIAVGGYLAGAVAPGAQAENGFGGVETLVQLGNVSELPVNAHCFYENANAHCSNTGEICGPLVENTSVECGTCVPGCSEIDFWVRLTPRQPIAWLVSTGMSELPIDGSVRVGIGGSSNAGSRIPPVPEAPFMGSLKCIVVDDTGTPIDQNVLKGEATFVLNGMADHFSVAAPSDLSPENLNVAKYNGVGIQALAGKVNDDRELVVGGPDPEYGGCPNILILDHFFDGTVSPAAPGTSEAPVNTGLILVPCQEDFLHQIPGSTVVQYLVYNEFEQRFSTSRTVDCQQVLQLSQIDTTQSDRSIFSAGVAGTTTGQTRISPLEGGLLGVALEFHGYQAAAFNLHYQGDRAEADVITLP